MFIYMMFGTDQDRYTFLTPWSGATCLPEDCCISELGRLKFNSARWPNACIYQVLRVCVFLFTISTKLSK
jgi:hypothetical protein